MVKWLSEQLDQVPFICTKTEQLDKLIKGIEEKQTQIKRYFEVHPKAKDLIFTDEKRKDRFLDSALSYLVLEGGDGVDIVPSIDKTEGENSKEYKDMSKVLAYQEACEYMHNAANSPDGYLEEQLLIRAHSQLYAGDMEARNYVRMRFRNEQDPQILMGQGYFNPVPGELVSLRTSYLIFNYNNAWYHDHPIVKGAKFVTEYFRIQPHLDGNKRVALMALNFILEKNGYPDIYIDKSQSDRFFDALKKGILGRDVAELATLIAENVNLRCDRRIDDIREYRIKTFEDQVKTVK